MRYKASKIFLSVVVCFLFTACSTVEYVPNSEVKFIDSDSLDKKSSGKKFGALVFRTSNKDDGKQTGRAFMIRKDKSAYVAETLLKDNSNNHKASFKKSYFSFGADKVNHSVGFKLRFVY